MITQNVWIDIHVIEKDNLFKNDDNNDSKSYFLILFQIMILSKQRESANVWTIEYENK